MIAHSRPATRQVNTTAVTIVVCIALGAVAAAMASLNVALPGLARSTQASQTQLEWIIDAYSLIFAALLLPGRCPRRPVRPPPRPDCGAGHLRRGIRDRDDRVLGR